MSRSGAATTHIAAPAEQVWALITDITRMGDWSPETVKAEWIGGATGPAVGARFKGSNKLGIMRWSTKPVVEVADAGREFTFVTTNGSGSKKYTRWSYRLSPTGDGTDVTESWEELGSLPIIGSLMMNDKREKRITAGMEQTLARIKAAAEA